MRTLLVGLDAACLPVLRPLFEDGRLPALAELVDDGDSAPLESQLPPWTASAWPSLYTGMNPGKHGVFDFLAFEGYDWDLVNASHVRERTIWEYLDERGYTSVVVNAPVTHPPRPIDGAIVPGYLAPEDPQCHPEGLLTDLREAIGEYQVYTDRETDERVSEGDRVAGYLELTHQRGEALRYLADRFDPDFGFVQFQKTDAVFHDFPGDMGKVAEVYEAVDEAVGRILADCDPDTVVVASDHGIGEYDGYECRVNEVLKRSDYVETAVGEGVPSWFQMKDERLVGGDGDDTPSTLDRVASAAGAVGITYQRVKGVLEAVGLASFVGRYVDVSTVYAASEAVDFESSTAYLRSPSELGIRLNLEGREPDGVVPQSEYESVREAVVDVLVDLETPAGEPVFEAVLPREEVFHGPRTEDAVDVVCVPTDFDHSLSALVGDPFVDPEPWNHKRHGVLAVAGDRAPDADLGEPHLFDVAPTVLATFDVPPDERMDGTSVPGVESPDPERYDPFDPGDRYGTDDEAVEQRLADLGYLE